MSRVIYRTRPFSPYAKYSKYWNEYIQEGDEIIKYVYNKVKFPDRELRNEIYQMRNKDGLSVILIFLIGYIDM